MDAKAELSLDRPAAIQNQAKFARRRRAQAGKTLSSRSELAFSYSTRRLTTFSQDEPAIAASSRLAKRRNLPQNENGR